MNKSQNASRYWWRAKVLLGVSLLIWLVITAVPLLLSYFEINNVLLGWPAVFGLTAFGVPAVYLIIIGVYSLVMDRLENAQDNHEGKR